MSENQGKRPLLAARSIPGTIPGGQRLRVDVHPPLADDEQPVLLSTGGGDVAIEAVEGHGAVIVRNVSSRALPFVIVIVPRAVAALARAPWGAIIAEAKQRGAGNVLASVIAKWLNHKNV